MPTVFSPDTKKWSIRWTYIVLTQYTQQVVYILTQYPQQVVQYEGESNVGYVREVYVFKKADDPTCPVVLHFPLVNHTFRTFKAPGDQYKFTVIIKVKWVLGILPSHQLLW